MATSLPEELEFALKRCPPLTTQTLEGFLGGLLEMDLEQLSQLPGSPGQVLAAQFCFFSRSSTCLEEEVRRRPGAFLVLVDALRRLPAANLATRRRKARGDTPHSQAAGG